MFVKGRGLKSPIWMLNVMENHHILPIFIFQQRTGYISILHLSITSKETDLPINWYYNCVNIIHDEINLPIEWYFKFQSHTRYFNFVHITSDETNKTHLLAGISILYSIASDAPTALPTPFSLSICSFSEVLKQKLHRFSSKLYQDYFLNINTRQFVN